MESLKDAKQQIIVFVPSVKKNNGTGHFIRACKLSQCVNLNKEKRSFVLLLNPSDLILSLKENFLDVDFIDDFLDIKNINLFVFDNFVSDENLILKAQNLAPIIALDEGSSAENVNYLLDIIPSGSTLNREPNKTEPLFLSGETVANEKIYKRVCSGDVQNILISFGGEDSAKNTVFVVNTLIKILIESFEKFHNVSFEKFLVTVCGSNFNEFDIPEKIVSKFYFCNRINDLESKIGNYDLVITHYGLTAFEAAFAGCGVLLLAPTELHKTLSLDTNFSFCEKNNLSNCLKKIFLDGEFFFSYKTNKFFLERKNNKTGINALTDFILDFSTDKISVCPVCHSVSPVIFRFSERNFRHCKKCDLIFQEAFVKKSEYKKNYFFDEYKKQYGKTYLEDFENIKMQGLKRIKKISKILNKKKSKKLLDVGCAYGPFLVAAKQKGFDVIGNDVSKDAVNYIKTELHLNANCDDFLSSNYSIKFDVLTMWYVIEHFEKLDLILNKVSELVLPNGVFAFSTPCLDGITGKQNKKLFCQNSPCDHICVFSKKDVNVILNKFGFSVKKIVSTGHHPERFAFYKKTQSKHKENSFILKSVYFILKIYSKLLKLGDTFEVYAIKTNDNCITKKLV